MRAIYNILWGRNEITNSKAILDENGYTYFRTAKAMGGRNILMGGDIANSVQTTLNKELNITSKMAREKYNNTNEIEELLNTIKKSEIADLFECYHYIGNFVLVPAYFNGWRGTNSAVEDYFDKSLKELKENGWETVKQLILKNRSKGEKRIFVLENAKRMYKDFSSEDFTTYINCMFMWEYVSVKNGEYCINSLREGDWLQGQYVELGENVSNDLSAEKIKTFCANVKTAISRRGIFMALMLKIALDYPGGNYKKKEWENWQVSDIYKQLVDNIFLSGKVYSGLGEIFKAIYMELDKSNLSEEDVKEIKGFIRAI